MKLRVVGCSPAWPNPGGVHSGYLLEAGGNRILLDCGPGVLPRLRAEEGWPMLDAIVITHFHLDHCGDLVPWLYGHLRGPAHGLRMPIVWLPPKGLPELEGLAAQFSDTFEVHEYVDGEPFEAAGFTVTARAVAHYRQPSWGLRVERDGRSLAYSADTGPTPVLAEIARGVDLFLCEATLDEPEDGLRGHLTHDEAAAAAEEAGAKRLLLTHRPVELDAPGFELAYDGFELELNSSA
ncbi:MAG TPA: MBL fold metallo-hydrolase [Gaiellaceae bacterium]|nr:MBL fold metallo-hydrolase [Gaiellaceae bacterium]